MKKNIFYKFLVIIIIAISFSFVLTACNKDKDQDTPYGYIELTNQEICELYDGNILLPEDYKGTYGYSFWRAGADIKNMDKETFNNYIKKYLDCIFWSYEKTDYFICGYIFKGDYSMIGIWDSNNENIDILRDDICYYMEKDQWGKNILLKKESQDFTYVISISNDDGVLSDSEMDKILLEKANSLKLMEKL